MIDVMNVADETEIGSVLFIIKDDGRDIKYENACKMWKMDAVIEHASQQGLKKALEEDYDMIVVDDYLPDRSGYNLSIEILNQKQAVLYMLGNDQDDISVIGAFRAGISDYIRSDVSAMQLAARCVSGIKRNKMDNTKKRFKKEGEKIRIDDFMLDTWNCTVEVNEKRVSLLKMEAEVLQVLMEYADEVVTKQEIYERAWNAPYIPGENCIAMHVSRIRKKLERIGAEEYIETKWGIGYRFRVRKEENNQKK